MLRRLLIPLSLAGAPLIAQNALPRKQIVEEMRIDGAAEDFPDMAGFRVGPRGQVAIYVHHDTHLRFYDANGRRVGIFGRKGSGPGEFQGYSNFGYVADTLWIYDPSHLRVTYISPALKLVRTEVIDHLNRMQTDPKSVPIGAMGSFDPQSVRGGRYIGTAGVATGRDANGMYGSTSRIISIPVRARTANLPEPGIVVHLADEVPLSSYFVTHRSGKGYWSIVIPFVHRPVTAFSPDGTRFAQLASDTGATPRKYNITMISTSGDTLFRRSYPFTGDRIPARIADSVLGLIGSSRSRPANASDQLRELARARMPKVYPPVSELVPGTDGSTWVQTRLLPKGSMAIALDARGNRLFEVSLPPRTTLVAATLTMLWVEQIDADDVSSVVRYRIR